MCNQIWRLIAALTLPVLVSTKVLHENTLKQSEMYFETNQRLLDFIESKNQRGIPPKAFSHTLNVSLEELYLRNIESIDEENGKMVVVFAATFNWNNIFVRWNPADYDGSNCVYIDDTYMWTVQFSMCDNFYTQSEGFRDNVMYVCSNGDVRIYTGVRGSIGIRLDAKNFPFDSLHAALCLRAQMGVSMDELDLHIPDRIAGDNAEGFVRQRVETHLYRWETTESMHCERNVQNKTQLNQQRVSRILCTFAFTRAEEYYIYQFCVPTSLVSFLALVGQYYSSISMPRSPAVQKFQLGITVMLSMSVLSLSIVSTVPKSTKMSRISVFYFYQTGLIFFATVFFGCTTHGSFPFAEKWGVDYNIVATVVFFLMLSVYFGSLLWFLAPII